MSLEPASHIKKNNVGPPSPFAAGTASPPRSGRRIFSAIELVFASRSMVYLIGQSRVFIPFYMGRVHHAPKNGRWCYSSLSLDGFRPHFETLNCIVPVLIIVRVQNFVDRSALFTSNFVDAAPS
jgi:hypothetical protein